MSGMGDDILGSRESFSGMDAWDRMVFESGIRRRTEERIEQEVKMTEAVMKNTVEIEGENNG